MQHLINSSILVNVSLVSIYHIIYSLLIYNNMILWYHDIMILWYYDNMILWYYDNLVI